jgi:predicted transcriptional regulator
MTNTSLRETPAPASPANPRAFTVATCATVLRWCKVIRGGAVEEQRVRPKVFKFREVSFGDMDGLETELRALAKDQRAAVLREDPAPGLDTSKLHPRRSKPDADQPATLIETQRSWIVIDVDSVAEPEGLDFRTDPARCAEYVRRELLPAAFCNKECVWKASGSAGVNPGIRMHQWYLLDKPIVGAQCSYWLRGHKVDRKLYDRAKVVTTADPDLDCDDPMSARMGRLPGAAEVKVPREVLDYVPPPSTEAEAKSIGELEPRPAGWLDVPQPTWNQKRTSVRLRDIDDGRIDVANETGIGIGRVYAAIAWNESADPTEKHDAAASMVAKWVAAELSHQPDAQTEKYEVEAAGGFAFGFAEAWAECHEKGRPASPIEFITGAALSAPQPRRKWVCEDLGLAPGRVSLFVGYGASGKTFAAQALGLGVASGSKAWGQFGVTQGPVVHLDCEMGRWSITDRYQRLAKGMGLQSERWTDRLFVASHPGVRLDELEKAEDLLRRTILSTGAKLMILDSLRALTPSTDENDSKIRASLDLLSRLSDQTGCTFVVIHHAGKTERSDSRQAPRGSSAIFDACDCVIQFEAGPGGKIRVSQSKAPGRQFEPFTIGLEDVGDDLFDPPLRVRVYESRDPVQAKIAQDETRISEIVEASPNCSLRYIRKHANMKATRLKDILEGLVEEGRILNSGTAANGCYTIAPKGVAP